MHTDFVDMPAERLAELERAAYMAGDVHTADLLDAVGDLVGQVDAAADAETLADWERNNGSAGEYRDFFDACFHHLDGHYPCPSIGSQHDQAVIFDAIRFGEAARDLLQRIAADGGNFADEARAMLAGDTGD